MTDPGPLFDCELPVSEALAYMQAKRKGSVLVSKDGLPAGIFTERDLLMKFDLGSPETLRSARLSDYMSAHLHTAKSDISCGEALDLMRREGIRNLPIVEDGAIIGIVSVSALLDHYSSHLERVLDETVEALASAIGQRDPYTADHQRRVSYLSVAIAEEMGLDAGRVETLRMAALVHDVGKIEVPIELLAKPGRLSAAEFELIKQHPQAGYQILESVDFEGPVADLVLQHHEKMDGSGYPKGLSGEAILLEARIMSIADVFEAIMSFRPYRPALGVDVARREIEDKRGSAFDPEAVDAFLRLLDEPGSGLMEDFKLASD
jgi:uncharacterized domain HDIG